MSARVSRMHLHVCIHAYMHTWTYASCVCDYLHPSVNEQLHKLFCPMRDDHTCTVHLHERMGFKLSMGWTGQGVGGAAAPAGHAGAGGWQDGAPHACLLIPPEPNGAEELAQGPERRSA